MAKERIEVTLKSAIPFILIISGVLALLASSLLTIEQMAVLKDPSYQPLCSLNPILSCGSVMNTDQASVFGFTNSLLGVMGYAVILTIGIVLLAGAQLKKWFWQGLNLGLLMGVIFVHWLFFQTVFRINSICPYCVVVWVTTIPMFWYVTLYNLREGNLKLPKSLNSLSEFIQKHHGNILLVWFAILAGIILNHFWYYWSTLL
jgi:uncharacterized membrane protein